MSLSTMVFGLEPGRRAEWLKPMPTDCVVGVAVLAICTFRRRPMDRLLRAVLNKLICAGNLRVTTVRGSTLTFGDGTGAPVAIRFTTRAAERGVLVDPEIRFGEAYMDGGVVVERGSIAD